MRKKRNIYDYIFLNSWYDLSIAVKIISITRRSILPMKVKYNSLHLCGNSYHEDR